MKNQIKLVVETIPLTDFQYQINRASQVSIFFKAPEEIYLCEEHINSNYFKGIWSHLDEKVSEGILSRKIYLN